MQTSKRLPNWEQLEMLEKVLVSKVYWSWCVTWCGKGLRDRVSVGEVRGDQGIKLGTWGGGVMSMEVQMEQMKVLEVPVHRVSGLSCCKRAQGTPDRSTTRMS